MRDQDRAFMNPPEKKSPAAAVEPTVRQPREKPGVLVVDDEHMVRIMVQLALERNGFDVWLAANGRDAIELHREYREDIAVVLLDVCMPGLDGPRTLEALREIYPGVPACFMTGNAGRYPPDELLQLGAAYVIAKPFHLDELANMLEMVASGQPASCFPSAGICRV
jgi:CheY-like chemotaxis protein